MIIFAQIITTCNFNMHKILIVDDEKPARDFIAELVTSCLPDSEITKADHPQKAIACLQREDL
jgi:CheY-like chemotaxis protein